MPYLIRSFYSFTSLYNRPLNSVYQNSTQIWPKCKSLIMQHLFGSLCGDLDTSECEPLVCYTAGIPGNYDRPSRGFWHQSDRPSGGFWHQSGRPSGGFWHQYGRPSRVFWHQPDRQSRGLTPVWQTIQGILIPVWQTIQGILTWIQNNFSTFFSYYK